MLLACLSTWAASIPVFAAQAQQLESPRLHAVVVEHAGDLDLRDTLLHTARIWHDAGDFLVGELDSGAIAALRARGWTVDTLDELGPQDNLFLVDLDDVDVRRDIDRAGSILHRRGRQAVVAVPHDLGELPESLRPGRTCHSGHTAISRSATRAPAPVELGAVQLASTQLAGGAPQFMMAVDPRIQTLVNQVSKTNIQSWDQSYSSSYTNRDSKNLANFNAAKAQLIAQLQSYGYAPSSESWDPTHGTNIVVDIPGIGAPNKYVVVGAHFDTRNYSLGVNAVAPGADDNTSGSCAVLEIARILASAPPFANSLRLVWFSGEEYGLLGSAANANAMASQGKQVVGMLNMDMISYRAASDTRDCDFATNSTSATLTALCQQICPQYVPNWASTSGVLTAGSSDHASYTSAGFPAVFFFEDLTQYYTQIHTVNDVYPTATTDFDLAQMICQGVLACAATLAEPADLALTHTELADTTDASGPYLVQASVTSYYGSNVLGATLNYRVQGAGSWTSLAMTGAGSSWSAAIPALGSPLSIEYYIDAFDDQNAHEIAPNGADLGARPFDFFVGTRTLIYSTGFEEATDNGWTHAQVATQDDWQRGVPMGKLGDPNAAFAGTRVWGNDLGGTGWNGSYANNVSNYLRSSQIDCSSAGNVHLQFRRWLTVESSQYDQARIKVNGTQVWVNPSSGDTIDTSWVAVDLDISAIAAHNASVQVEFSLQSDAGVSFGGWNLDEFALVELGPGVITCPGASTYCSAKQNSLGCTPLMATNGNASASSGSPFTLSASQVISQKNGLLFYGFAGAASPFQGGYKCVANPVRRTAAQSAGGNPSGSDCSGVLSLDFNALIQGGGDPALVQGADVFAQWWYRDPADPLGFATGLSNAAQFRICP